MVMRSNYPDYNRISEIDDELEEIDRRQYRGHFDEEDFDKQPQLREERARLVMGEPVEVGGKSCKESHCGIGVSFLKPIRVYYSGRIHHLDGDISNESFGNLAMVCPICQAHILLSRFSPKDIWLLKTRGLSNAEIGRLLDISRERVRQLYEKYEAKREAELIALTGADVDDLVKQAENFEDHLIARGRLRRRIDRRTKKKRIIAGLEKLKNKGGTK